MSRPISATIAVADSASDTPDAGDQADQGATLGLSGLDLRVQIMF